MTFAPQRACTHRDERAGRGCLFVRHEAALCDIRTLRHRPVSLRHNDFVIAAARNLALPYYSKGPARSELIPVRARSLGHADPPTTSPLTAGTL